MSKQGRGFTLIELLVVIAIIGILASIVLASLNSARSKGGDGAVVSNVTNMRAQAEIYYNSNSFSYTNLCNQPELLRAASSTNTAGGSFSCSSIGTQFRVSSVLSTTEHFCIDNNGFAGRLASAPSGTQCN